jgi:hypothetical protein
METITTIGLDIAKSVFQVHGVDAQGKVIVRRALLVGPRPIFRQPAQSLGGTRCEDCNPRSI